VSRWENGSRAPQQADAARLRSWLGKDTGSVVDVFDLRSKLGMTQRVFGAQFGVSRQQVQKWELIATGHQLKKEHRAGTADREIANLVDDEQCRMRQHLQARLESTGGLRFLERGKQIGQRAVIDATAALRGRNGET
jgi:hypothetical protein